jgi:hypothetical protein
MLIKALIMALSAVGAALSCKKNALLPGLEFGQKFLWH